MTFLKSEMKKYFYYFFSRLDLFWAASLGDNLMLSLNPSQSPLETNHDGPNAYPKVVNKDTIELFQPFRQPTTSLYAAGVYNGTLVQFQFSCFTLYTLKTFFTNRKRLIYSEILASTVSTLLILRGAASKRSISDTRDLHGNRISNQPSELQTFSCDTASIPSAELEEICRVMATDDINSAFVYHQQIQG